MFAESTRNPKIASFLRNPTRKKKNKKRTAYSTYTQNEVWTNLERNQEKKSFLSRTEAATAASGNNVSSVVRAIYRALPFHPSYVWDAVIDVELRTDCVGDGKPSFLHCSISTAQLQKAIALQSQWHASPYQIRRVFAAREQLSWEAITNVISNFFSAYFFPFISAMLFRQRVIR